MLKNVKWFFVVLVFSSFISLSFDKRKTPTEKLPLGAQAPELVLGKEKQPLSLQAAKGNYILLSFGPVTTPHRVHAMPDCTMWFRTTPVLR